jgi:hypothetical protein
LAGSAAATPAAAAALQHRHHLDDQRDAFQSPLILGP